MSANAAHGDEADGFHGCGEGKAMSDELSTPANVALAATNRLKTGKPKIRRVFGQCAIMRQQIGMRIEPAMNARLAISQAAPEAGT